LNFKLKLLTHTCNTGLLNAVLTLTANTRTDDAMQTIKSDFSRSL